MTGLAELRDGVQPDAVVVHRPAAAEEPQREGEGDDRTDQHRHPPQGPVGKTQHDHRQVLGLDLDLPRHAGVLEATHLGHLAAEEAQEVDVVPGRRMEQRTGDGLFSQPLPDVQVAGDVMEVVGLGQRDLAQLALLLQLPRILGQRIEPPMIADGAFTFALSTARTILRQSSRVMAMGFSR